MAGGESEAAADLSVLDELIMEVQEDVGPDSPEFYDGVDAGGEGMSNTFTADDVLRQLDTVTRLSDSDDKDEDGEDDGDGTILPELPPNSPVLEPVEAEDGAITTNGSNAHVGDEGEGGGDTELCTHATVEPVVAVDDELFAPEVRDGAGPDFEKDSNGGTAEELPQRDTLKNEALQERVDGGGGAPCAVPDSAVTSEEDYAAVERVAGAETESVVAFEPATSEDASEDQEEALPPPHATGSDTNGDEAVVPPPAPTRAAVVMSGSMNPQVDDDSDDSDSDEEVDRARGESPAAPVMSSHDSTDDDEDELEIDPTVASTIEPTSRRTTKADAVVVAGTGLKPGTSGFDAKADDATAGFGDEIRVATVVMEGELDRSALAISQEKAAKGFGAHEKSVKAKQERQATKDDAAAFGIAYHSFRKRPSQAQTDENDEYTLTKGPAFPDEKEFEGELQIDSHASFSTKGDPRQPRRQLEGAGRGTGEGGDDEFGFDGAGAAPSDVVAFSEEGLESWRASIETRTAQQEAELLEELKRATEDERKMIERAEAAEHQQSAATAVSSEADTTLSLGELHSMYKRGLGDQSVHFLGEAGEASGAEAAAAGSAPAADGGKKGTKPPQERLSVMGRLLSKPGALTDAIVEGENEDEGDELDGAGGELDADEMSAGDASRLGVRPDQQTLLNYGDEDDEADEDEAEDEDEDVGGGEWKEIQLTDKAATVGASNAADGAAAPSPSPHKPQWRISYTESAGYFAEAPEFLDHRDRIVPEEFPARSSCFSCLSRPRLTFPGAIDERDRVFCVAATAFDPANDVFCRMLQTIYARLVPSASAPALIGGHWEQIGFQGSDPATDLRGVGVLALLQMLHLVESYGELARRLHSQSQHSTRHFPFACALVNVTLQCLVALRSGALYPECNKHASVVAGLNVLFVALASELSTELAATTDDVPLVLKRVLDRGRLEPMATITAVFDSATGSATGSSSEQPNGAAGSASAASTPSPVSPRARPSASTNVEFTEIALHSVADD